MTDRNEQNSKEQNARADDMTKLGGGKQGVDQDPAKQSSRSEVNPVFETQKGKAKEDGDPSKPSDQPADENIF